MTNAFDKKLPVTTSYWVEGEIFIIKNTSFRVTNDQGYAIAELMLYAMTHQGSKGVLIDNREAKGAWPSSLEGLTKQSDHALGDLPRKRMATLTNSAITTLQVKRLSKGTEVESWSRVYNKDFDSEVRNFLLGR